MIDFLLALLATRLAAKSYVEDNGPADIFFRLDSYFASRQTTSGLHRFFMDAGRCITCTSLWFAMGLTVIRAISRPLFLFLSIPLAISGLITWFDSILVYIEGRRRVEEK